MLYVYFVIEWLYRNNIKVLKFIFIIDKNRFVFYDNMFFIFIFWIDGEKCSFDNINYVKFFVKKFVIIYLIFRDFYFILGSLLWEGFDDYYIIILKYF